MKFYGYADNGQQVWFFFNGEFLPVEEYKMVVTTVIGCGYREITTRFVARKSGKVREGGKYER